MGLSQDYAQAAKWYRIAAEQGEAKAQARLGSLYCRGLGVPQSYAEAYFWESLAAAGAKQHRRASLVEIREEYASKLSPDELSEVQARVSQWLVENQSMPKKAADSA
jgi:TPR repeat protein